MHSVAVFVVCYGYAHNLCGFGGGLVVGYGSEGVFSLRFSVSVCSGLYWLVVRCCCEFGLLGVVGWLLGRVWHL